MRKYLILFLIIITSCQKEELFEFSTTVDIFSQSEVIIQDSQIISFETPEPEKYTLVILNPDNNSILTKESFVSDKGLNTRNIYTKVLPKQKLKLVLLKGSEESKSTFIVVK